MRKSPGKALAAAALAIGLSLVGAAPAGAVKGGVVDAGRGGADQTLAYGRTICYQADVIGLGWQNAVCNGAVAGSVGQGQTIGALRFVTGSWFGLCARVFMAGGTNWEGWSCADDGKYLQVGIPGHYVAVQAIEFRTDSGPMGIRASLSGSGWLGWSYGGNVWTGVGEFRAFEAFAVNPNPGSGS
ncbi:hypothetical protein [Kitasatospora sp. NBC_00458]|uniref:hypothetical protein n=1 Tax=Kitasatospora sp. NBC_00458 TaxID=2903568 RepID=UPI002E16CE16